MKDISKTQKEEREEIPFGMRVTKAFVFAGLPDDINICL
jgi:hypothetical protein